MYLFHESPQRHKAGAILGPPTKGLRSDQNTFQTEIILMPLLYLFEHSFEIKGPSELLVLGAQNLVSLLPGEHSASRNCLIKISKQFLLQKAETNISASQQKLLLTSTLSQLFLLALFLVSQISGAWIKLI